MARSQKDPNQKGIVMYGKSMNMKSKMMKKAAKKKPMKKVAKKKMMKKKK